MGGWVGGVGVEVEREEESGVGRGYRGMGGGRQERKEMNELFRNCKLNSQANTAVKDDQICTPHTNHSPTFHFLLLIIPHRFFPPDARRMLAHPRFVCLFLSTTVTLSRASTATHHLGTAPLRTPSSTPTPSTSAIGPHTSPLAGRLLGRPFGLPLSLLVRPLRPVSTRHCHPVQTPEEG